MPISGHGRPQHNPSDQDTPVQRRTRLAVMHENDPLWKLRHALAGAGPIPPGSLKAEDLILLEDGHCLRDHALAAFGIEPPRGEDVFAATSLHTLVQMVSAGIGVTLIPEMAVAVETRSAAVSVANFAAPQPSRTIGMVWRKSSPLAKQLLQISEVVREAAAELRAAHRAGRIGA